MNTWVVYTPLSIKLKWKSFQDFSEYQWAQNDVHWNEHWLIVTGPYQEHRGLPLKNNLSLPVAQSGSWWDSPAMNADSKLDARLVCIFLTWETCSLEYETICGDSGNTSYSFYCGMLMCLIQPYPTDNSTGHCNRDHCS